MSGIFERGSGESGGLKRIFVKNIRDNSPDPPNPRSGKFWKAVSYFKKILCGEATETIMSLSEKGVRTL